MWWQYRPLSVMCSVTDDGTRQFPWKRGKAIPDYKPSHSRQQQNMRMGNVCSPHLGALFCSDTDKWQWPQIWYMYMFSRLGLLLFLLAAGGSSLARLSHSGINSYGKKILFPLRCSSQECNPNNQIYHSWMFNYIHTYIHTSSHQGGHWNRDAST